MPVTVDFNTADITATSSSDYVATSGTLVFAPGVTSRTIIVPMIDHLVQESDETFEVTLSNAVGASITYAQGIGTILDHGYLANQPPTAEAGGPYAVGQGGSVTLHSSRSDPDQDAGLLDYLWDLDGDGLFGEVGAGAVQGDEVGPTPTFHAANLPGESAHDIALRVIDLGGLEAEDTAVVTSKDSTSNWVALWKVTRTRATRTRTLRLPWPPWKTAATRCGWWATRGAPAAAPYGHSQHRVGVRL